MFHRSTPVGQKKRFSRNSRRRPRCGERLREVGLVLSRRLRQAILKEVLPEMEKQESWLFHRPTPVGQKKRFSRHSRRRLKCGGRLREVILVPLRRLLQAILWERSTTSKSRRQRRYQRRKLLELWRRRWRSKFRETKTPNAPANRWWDNQRRNKRFQTLMW